MVLQLCGYYNMCGLDGLYYCWYIKAIWGRMLQLNLLGGNRSGYETLLVSVGLDSVPSMVRLACRPGLLKTVRESCVGLRRSGSVVGLVAFQTEREGRGLQHSSSNLKSWLCKVGTYPYIQFGSVVCAGNLCTGKLLIQPELLSVLVIRKMCAHKFAYLKCSPLLRKDNKMRGQFSHSTR